LSRSTLPATEFQPESMMKIRNHGFTAIARDLGLAS
jgi:hypothetical protein